jgi:galactonate dehydratase
MTRRSLLSLPWLPSLLSAPPARLTAIEIFRVPVNHLGGWVLVRVQTDQGITGIGDASHGKDEQTIPLLRKFFGAMKGRLSTDVEYLRAIAEPDTGRGGFSPACALGAIEQAMWDINGQLFGVPVHALFGGKLRDRIRCYANINRSTRDRQPVGFAKNAERAIRSGLDAIKLAPFDGWPKDASKAEAHVQEGLACASAVRSAIGPKADLLIDGHSHFSLERGLQLSREFEPMNLFWLEEVCRGIENLAAIDRAAKMPTAGGESLFGVKAYHPYIAGKAVDIVMPDIKYCGGLLEMKKISAMAEGAGQQSSPHGPASPVGNIAAAHVCATLPNFLILEYSFGETDWRAELIEPAEQLINGQIQLNDRPGFGVKLNDALLRKLGTA